MGFVHPFPESKARSLPDNVYDLGDIAERVDNGRRLAPVECLPALAGEGPTVDSVAHRAEEQIAELHGRVAEAESVLAYLAGLVADHHLGAAAINAAGIKLGEVREQLPAMRQAVRGLESRQ